MTFDSLPRPKASVIYKEMDDGAVLYCPHSEIYFGLDPVGVSIWRYLEEEGAGGLDGLVRSVGERFPDAPRDELPSDVKEFLTELLEAELVVERAPVA